jgi:hypothetical protein
MIGTSGGPKKEMKEILVEFVIFIREFICKFLIDRSDYHFLLFQRFFINYIH